MSITIFHHQATQATYKANAFLGQLKQAFKCWSVSTFNQLYVSFVRPHIEYAVAAWSPYTKRDLKILEQVQRRATKLVISLRLTRLGFTTIKARRERGDLIETLK